VPVRKEAASIAYWFGTNTDVDEQRRTRGALDPERRRLTAVFENASIGLVFADTDGRIVSGNRRVEQMFGHPILYSKDIVSYREWIAFHPDGRRVERRESPLAQALNDGETPSGEYLYQLGHGTKIWVEFTGAPIRDVAGHYRRHGCDNGHRPA
jgi:PAS domain S-box-containing protein